ncbi:MAG: hypothetical protein KAU89_02060 [Candidatus Thorarchaeota archaeon]|nr:hypothetical protein [Candidatus Thorarchaeota archaeon]
MKGIRSSDSPRGVGIIAALEILCGMGCSAVGLLFLFFDIVNGLLLIGYGVVLIAIGWALDALHSWAWWGNILTNAVLLLGTLIRMLMDFPSDSTTLFSNIISIALSTVITVYLLKPSVRSQFS